MIKFIKLTTGDDIIADVTDNVYKNPYKIVMSREGLGLMPLMLFSKDKEFTIKPEHVLTTGEPEDDMRAAYTTQVTGIVVPSSGVKNANNMLITE